MYNMLRPSNIKKRVKIEPDDSNLYMYDNNWHRDNSSKSGKKNDSSGKKVSLTNKKGKKTGSNKKELNASP